MAKHDPKELFVVSALTRAGIAELLNNAASEMIDPDDVDPFTKDDPRLTKKVCQGIADLLYDAQLDEQNEVDEHVMNDYVETMPRRMYRATRK